MKEIERHKTFTLKAFKYTSSLSNRSSRRQIEIFHCNMSSNVNAKKNEKNGMDWNEKKKRYDSLTVLTFEGEK